MAAMKINATVVTVYATLGADALVYCLNQTEVRTVAADSGPFDLLVQ